MKSLKTILLLLSILSFQRTIFAQTIVTGGYVSGNWDASHSPYLVEGDLLVHPDSTLIIGEGATISFRGHYRLEILGRLLVKGTAVQPVNFGIYNGVDYWKGLQFNTTDTSITDSSILEHGTISNCQQNACLNITNSSRLRISHFTIEHGDSFRGGGVSCSYSNPLFEDLIIQNNSALDGAGLSLEHSNPILKNCTISKNSADGAGGGIVIFDQSSPVFDSCTISGNYSYGSGGGIYINDSYPVFRNCLISGNDGAQGDGNLYSGGGVSVKLDSHPYFENCLFENNTSQREGGAIASFSLTEMVDCLFQANSAQTLGGAVYLSSVSQINSRLTNCTFSDNDCVQGTALAIYTQTAIINNCILWHSTPSNPGSLIHLDSPFSWNLMDVNYSDIQNGQESIEGPDNDKYIWGEGNIELDPSFMPDSWELSWQSPCIEAGTPDTTGLYLPDLDLGGSPRLMNERVDMGAYEYQLPVIIQNSKFKIQNYLRIFPNPAKNYVYLESSYGLPDSWYHLYNSSGELVLRGRNKPGQDLVELNISRLAEGIYLIVVQGEDFKLSKKIIIIN